MEVLGPEPGVRPPLTPAMQKAPRRGLLHGGGGGIRTPDALADITVFEFVKHHADQSRCGISNAATWALASNAVVSRRTCCCFIPVCPFANSLAFSLANAEEAPVLKFCRAGPRPSALVHQVLNC